MPLLWVLRDVLGMTGTKYGCGIQICGACTVHLNDEPVRSCGLPVSAAAGKRVVTIEGLSRDGDQTLGLLQRRFRSCLSGICAEMLPYGASEYLDLELYVTWRGNGLPIETPGVRR